MTATLTAPTAPRASAPPGEPVVRIDRLSKRFAERRTWGDMLRHPFRRSFQDVLQSVTFDVRKGEFFGLLGPNGAGKTTLFKTLSTLVLPDSGSVTLAGHDVVKDAAQIRHVLAPVITDERSLYWRISARENLRLFAVLRGLRGAAVHERVQSLLETVELDGTEEKMVGQFSSGMKQRLLIARALLSSPQILLLDEPTRSLDPVSARRFRRFLRDEVIGRQGCTVLLATHNSEEALELCDRVGVLDRGRLLAVGTADSISRTLGDERYRLWTRTPEHAAFEALERRDIARRLPRVRGSEEGWTSLEMEIPGGPDRAADVLSFAASEGVSISRFERVEPSLADLIEQVVARQGEEVPHA